MIRGISYAVRVRFRESLQVLLLTAMISVSYALGEGNVGTLYRLGVNGFLMGYLARYEVCGLNVEIYNQRMRAVRVDEIGRPLP